MTLATAARAQQAAPVVEAPPLQTEPPNSRAQHDAERGPIALHWVRLPGTERCIAGDALARAVESKLRRSVFPAARDASILIEGHVRKTEAGYAAELHMRDQGGTALGSRELSSDDETCRELSDTVGVVLAVMIDPDAAKRPAPAAPAAESRPVGSASEPDRGGDDRLLVFGRALIAITEQPLLGFGTAYERALGVAGGLRIEVAMFAERATRVDIGRDEAEAVVRVTYAGVAYCPLWLSFERTRLSGCAGIELGAVRGHGNGFPRLSSDQRGWWASGSASLRLTIRIAGPLEAHLGAGLLGAFGDAFVVRLPDGKQPILPRHPAQLGALLDLGLGARF